MPRCPRLVGLGLLAGILTTVLLWSGPPGTARASGCVTRLPAVATLPSAFAAAYRSTIPLGVSTTGGPIRNLRAAIYTFSGDQIAVGARGSPLTSSATVNLKLQFGPLQEGSYTLVVTGEPNANPSCGPKKYTKVLTFHGCMTSLPLKFVDLPAGTAADYGNYLSVPLQSTGPLIRNLEGAVYSFDGTLFGEGTLSALYGRTTVSMMLNRPLIPGDYTVVVAGLINQPRSCGPKTAQVDLHFQ